MFIMAMGTITFHYLQVFAFFSFCERVTVLLISPIFHFLGHYFSAKSSCKRIWPNVAAEWIAFPFRTLEVLGANLGPETGCADLDFCGYLSSLQANARIVREIKIRLILSV
jgi:hypothetical protein